MTPMPSADKYEITTEAMRYSGATTARRIATKIRNTIRMVITMMRLMS